MKMQIPFLVLLLVAASAKAEILFEGYYKFYANGGHAGYFLSRYEYDAAKKQFSATTFLKTGEAVGSLTESLKATAAEDLSPIAYQYTSLEGSKTKSIDAKFEKGKMVATVTTAGKVEKINKALPKGTFLSSFLTYVMLKSKTGLKVGTKYDYEAIAEEEGSVAKGSALIKESAEFNGVQGYRVVNDFKGNFSSIISNDGGVLSVKVPALGLAEELVPQPGLATNNFPIPTSLLKSLFGDVPTGQVNQISKKGKQDN